MNPHISVCIPVYQGATTLAATLRSVLASECDDFEVVVRDNGSSDDCEAIVARFGDPRVRYLRYEDTVPLPQSWQACVEEAHGELIKVVCADDLLHPSCLSSQAEVLHDPSVSLVACRRDIIDGADAVLTRGAGLPRLVGRHSADEVAKVAVRFGINPIGESVSVMFRRRDFDAIGGFDGSLVFPMDIDAWLRLLDLGDLIGQAESYAAFRVWPDSLSSLHNENQLDEHLRFLTRIANDERYRIPPGLRRCAPGAARLSWWGWAARHWLWVNLPRGKRNERHSWSATSPELDSA